VLRRYSPRSRRAVAHTRGEIGSRPSKHGLSSLLFMATANIRNPCLVAVDSEPQRCVHPCLEAFKAWTDGSVQPGPSGRATVFLGSSAWCAQAHGETRLEE
jgi:hypothetical protein